MNFAEAMRGARERTGMTVPELAEQSKVSKESLYLWEKGSINPRIDSAVMVADALGISVADYIGHKVKRK